MEICSCPYRFQVDKSKFLNNNEKHVTPLSRQHAQAARIIRAAIQMFICIDPSSPFSASDTRTII
ncbi:MAG: hypothetical protein MESAZ_00371 [Saezia sanguinis]